MTDEREPVRPSSWRLRIAVLAGAIFLAVLAALFATNRWTAPVPAAGSSGKALVGGPFVLVDHHGMEVTDEDFRGRLLLVYFGYTFCPDVCPLELQTMSRVLELLGRDAGQIQPLFITIDPERDTPQVMADYVAHFHPGLVGLSGSAEQIRDVAGAYRVFYDKAEDGSDRRDYFMDHSSYVFVMDREGQYLRHFSANTSAEEMARGITPDLR